MTGIYLTGVVWPPGESLSEWEAWEDRVDRRPKRAFGTLESAREAVEAEMQDAIEDAEWDRPKPNPTWPTEPPADPHLKWELQEGTEIEEWRCDLLVPYGPDPAETRPFGWVRHVAVDGIVCLDGGSAEEMCRVLDRLASVAELAEDLPAIREMRRRLTPRPS